VVDCERKECRTSFGLQLETTEEARVDNGTGYLSRQARNALSRGLTWTDGGSVSHMTDNRKHCTIVRT
jgi:hypothetical protein